MLNLTQLPGLLIGCRFLIAPLLLVDAVDHQTSIWFLVGYVLAILSDIFDGIIARRLGVSTPQLRQADSWADIWLFSCLALSTWWVHPEVLQQLRVPLLVAVGAQFSLFGISLIKFRKLPSFHTYTAKVWGITLLVATLSLFGRGDSRALWVAISACLINSLEEIVMTLVLTEWHCDVLSLFHALKLRQSELAELSEATPKD